MENLKVSVITVCYNSAKTIEQTIQSVINQSYPYIEYIIIDGGSTDGTLDIIRKYESHIAKWVSEPDEGIYDAMNKGIRLATGEVVGIINSDDWYAEDILAVVAKEFIRNNNSELVYGDVMTVGAKEDHRLTKGSLAGMPGIEWYWQPTVFMRLSAYRKYGLFNTRYKIGADLAYFLYLETKGIVTSYIPMIIAYFRWGGISSKKKYMWRKSKERIHIFLDLLNDLSLTNEQANKYNYGLEKSRQIDKAALGNYAVRRLYRYGHQSDFWQYMLHKYQKEQYIVWGAGSDGEDFWQDNYSLHDKIRCYVDKNPAKYGYRFHNVPISLPWNSVTKNDLIIIASARYSEEMQRELNTWGFAKEHDYIVYNDDSFWNPVLKYSRQFICTGHNIN